MAKGKGKKSGKKGPAKEAEQAEKPADPVVMLPEGGDPNCDKCTDKWAKAVMMSIDELKPVEWNPNEMSDPTFNNLVQDIEKHGFDEPLQVALDEDGKYMILGGEHRWKACRILGIDKVPVIIKTGMSPEEMKIYTVRRNMLRGDLDTAKFTRLVKDVTETHGIDPEKLPALMAFENDKDFKKKIKSDKQEDQTVKQQLESAGKEARAVENLSFILNEIFAKYGDTIPSGYMFFMYGKKMHLMLQMEPDTAKAVEDMADWAKRDDHQMNNFVCIALNNQLEALAPKEIRG